MARTKGFSPRHAKLNTRSAPQHIREWKENRHDREIAAVTVIGDTVNFASRLEALNEEFGSQLLISAAVREALGEDGGDAVALGEVPIRGYEQPMMVWQLG